MVMIRKLLYCSPYFLGVVFKISELTHIVRFFSLSYSSI